MAWGYDTAGVEYKVTYENEAPAIQAPAALSAESRVVGGPTRETMDEIFSKIEEVAYEPLIELGLKLQGPDDYISL
jgi:hypothetical protein